MSAPFPMNDSGPLIALARLDLLAIHSRLLGELVVTATVRQEVMRGADMLERPRPLNDALRANGYFLAQLSVDRMLTSVGE